MIKLIDTHAHMDFDDYAENIEEILNNALSKGINKIVVPGVTLKDTDRIINLVEKYDNLFGALAVHPTEAKNWDENSYDFLKEKCSHPKIIAIGETGLDYYWDKSYVDVQKQVFKEHIKLAKELGKPIIVHDRDAHEDTFNILKQENASEVGVVMHCFSGSAEFAKQCEKEGFYIALGGPVTFKNAKKPKEVAQAVSIEKLLLETDSPFLAPHPYRGKQNDPSKIILVAQEIARLRNMSVEEVASMTTKNAEKLFGL